MFHGSHQTSGDPVFVNEHLTKGSSIYDVHKKITFLTPLPPVHMRPHGPDPPLWTSTRSRHEIHTALLKWLVQWPTKPTTILTRPALKPEIHMHPLTQGKGWCNCATIFVFIDSKQVLYHDTLFFNRDVIPPEAMMHIPFFQISHLFSKNFQTVENFQILPFPEKFSYFHPPKFLMTFFSYQLQIWNFPPISAVSVHLPPILEKDIISQLLLKISLWFRQIYVFLHAFCMFSFPTPLLWSWCIYASHNARTGRPWKLVGLTVERGIEMWREEAHTGFIKSSPH